MCRRNLFKGLVALPIPFHARCRSGSLHHSQTLAAFRHCLLHLCPDACQILAQSMVPWHNFCGRRPFRVIAHGIALSSGRKALPAYLQARLPRRTSPRSQKQPGTSIRRICVLPAPTMIAYNGCHPHHQCYHGKQTPAIST